MNTYGTLFGAEFLVKLRFLIELHSSIHPRIPPQRIFFESLVKQAFIQAGWSADQVTLSTANIRGHDLLVGETRVSIKTQTGAGTRPLVLDITKLCTTEREPWDSATLIAHTMDHLAMYDRLLMLRAIWGQRAIRYQLLEIPLDVLRFDLHCDCSSSGSASGPQQHGRECVRQRGEDIPHPF